MFKITSTYNKLVSILFLSSLLFVLLFCSLYFYNRSQQKDVLVKTNTQFKEDVDVIMKLYSKIYIPVLDGFTVWDEYVKFITTRDQDWYTREISECLEINKADFMTAYDLKGIQIGKTFSKKIRTNIKIPNSVLVKLYKNKTIRFYLKSKEGIVEVFGATVHPSKDPFRVKTKPSGYFFIVRLLDKQLVQNIAATTHSKIKIVTNLSQNNTPDTIQTYITLKDSENQKIAYITFERNFDIDFNAARSILFIIMVAFLINLMVYLYFFKKFIFDPLSLITSLLETGAPLQMRKLKRNKGEFGYIGKLFEDSIIQKRELINSKIKAEESERLKAAFLSNLSHEIRTPMNAINGFTDLLLTTSLNDAQKLEYLKVIDKSGKILVSIIDDLIEMSKIDALQVKPNFSVVNIDICLSEVYDSIKITIPADKLVELSILKSLSIPKYNIITDEIKLKQVLVNLINNAIKYTSQGTVSVGYNIDEVNEIIEFFIEDTGVGISKVDQTFIFDRFKRIDSDIAVKEGGIGLGLSISQAYVEILGGKIKVKSSPGNGSVFSFTIPLKYKKNEKMFVKTIDLAENIVESNVNINGVILIAEDDNINFLLFQRILVHKNYIIIRANNGQEAVNLCAGNSKIDLIFMDIKMPVMNGFEAREVISQLRPEIPIVAQTAYSSSEDLIKFREVGFANYLTKPIDKNRLFKIIDKYINKTEE